MARQRGWVLNLDSDDASREIESDQQPAIVLSDGEIVFEVWKYYPKLGLWFVMSTRPNTDMEAQGVVYYHPSEVPDRLRARVQLIERMQRTRR